MAVYIISKLTIHDRAEYEQYEHQFEGVFSKFDGTLLSVEEEPLIIAGQWNGTRSILIEFPSKESAFAWMQSEEYQAIAVHRDAGSALTSIMVRSLEPG